MQGLEQASEQAMTGMTGMGTNRHNYIMANSGKGIKNGVRMTSGAALRPAGYDRGDGFISKISMNRSFQ
jgi:hypothetical protein